MNKTNNFIWIISFVVLCVLGVVFYNTYNKKNTSQPTPVFSDEFISDSKSFSDGLKNPDSVTRYELDEFDIGLSEKSIYYEDINSDKKPDRITKSLIETGNAHSYYEYKIELNVDGKFVDITPENFRTVNGADCDLQQIQFVFQPQFKIVFISRYMGDTWDTPTAANKKVFKFSGDKLQSGDVKKTRPVCDVKELFF